MPLLTELELPNRRLDNAIWEHRRALNDHTRCLDHLEAQERRVEHASARVDLWTHIVASFEATVDNPDLVQELHGHKNRAVQASDATNNDVENAHRHLTQTKQRLSRALEEKEAAEAAGEAERKVTKVGLKEALRNVDAVDPKSICLGVNQQAAEDRPFLRWHFTGVKMTPQNNKYPAINGGEPPQVPLQDIVMTVYPKTGAVTFTAKRGESHLPPPTYDNGRAVHPHVMPDNLPCWGDFGGPATEAIDARDWNTLATIAQMFLEAVDPYDPAGEHWYKYITGDIRPLPIGRDGYGFPGDHPNSWSHWVLNEDGGFDRVESTDPREIIPPPVDAAPPCYEASSPIDATRLNELI